MDEDQNLKNAEMSAKMAVLQDTVREYQEKLKDLSNKVYTGKYRGVEIKMKGDFSIVSVIFDQGVYETSSKGNLEQIIVVCFTNLKKAITDEQEYLSQELKNIVDKYQVDLPFNV